MKKWYKTGWDYIEFLKQFPSMENKKFIDLGKPREKDLKSLPRTMMEDTGTSMSVVLMTSI